jgi:hypothetical protein
MDGGGLFVMALAATIGVAVTAALVVELSRHKRTSRPLPSSARPPRRAG